MEKIVKAGFRDCTVNLDGTECAVKFDSCFRAFAVRNDSTGDVYISKVAGIVPNADGVMSVKAGASTVFAHMDIYADTVYLLGNGKVQLHAQNDTVNPFEVAPDLGGGKEVSGESAYTIENAVDYPVMGLNLYGKSVQDGTPKPTAPVDIVSVGDSGSVGVTACGKNLFDYSLLPNAGYNGVTFTNNNDGTYTIRGAKDDVSKSFLVISELSHEESIKMFSPGTYTLSGIPKEWGWGAHLVVHVFYNGQAHNSLMNTVNRPVLTITKDMLTDDFAVSIGFYSASNNQINNGTFYIQIEKGSTATDYEPYHGTTANITSALPLCGIPVESGGNYTDSSGQQWVCDELVYNADGSGKIVKRTAKIVFNNNYAVNYAYDVSKAIIYNVDTNRINGKVLCNVADYAIAKWDADVTGNCFWGGGNLRDIFVRVPVGLTNEEINNMGIKVIYQLADPLEIPLTAAEMSALRTLQTFNGITNISNDGGADMSVGYCTNKMLSEYVVPITSNLQKQIDELKSAVLSLGGNV